MKKSLILSSLLLAVLFLSNCNKEIDEPKQKADGRNLVFVRVDDKDEFLLDSRSKFFHKNTASDLRDNDKIGYFEYNLNNRVVSEFYFGFNPLESKKTDFKGGSIRLRFDKESQAIDTAFLNSWLTNFVETTIFFNLKSSSGYKQYFIDSILDYKVIKWDTEKKIFTFSANCTYITSPQTKPTNPKIYFYIDISY